MSNPFIGQMILFAGDFTIAGYAACDGSTYQVADYSSLFSLIQAVYGGNGKTTFNVPDLRGRVTVGQGQGPGLSPYNLGMAAGAETVAVTAANMPAHTHPLFARSSAGTSNNPAGAMFAVSVPNSVYSSLSPAKGLNAAAITPAGSKAKHANLRPYVALNWLIAVNGIYPSQS